MAPSLVLPALEYPFDWAVNPFAAQVDEACFLWGERMGIYHLGDPRDYRGTRVGRLAAYTCPHGTREGLRLLADWQMWLFAFDDGFCDESEHGSRPAAMARRVTGFLGVLEGARPPDGDPFDHALADVLARLSRCASGFQLARFTSAVRGYFLAQCWEATNRAEGTPPSLAEYVHMRRHSGAVPTCTALIDVAGGFELPAEQYDHPELVALTDMAVNVACWANDILSYPKEAQRSHIVHSLPAVLAHQHDLDTEAAIAEVARMHDDEVRRYLLAEERVRAHADPLTHRYLDDLRFWMSGNLQWSHHTGRYQTGKELAS
jgi:hypothetical protein